MVLLMVLWSAVGHQVASRYSFYVLLKHGSYEGLVSLTSMHDSACFESTVPGGTAWE